MSAEDPVIPVTDESFEPDSIDSSALPPSEHPAAKEVFNVDSSSVDPVTEPPAQTTTDDTHTVLLKHDTNIPNPTPTNPNGSANGAETTTLVNEPDNTVEIRNVDDDAGEDKVPIKHEANGDVGGTASGGTDGADLDLADQTLVEDVSRDADVSLIQEIAGVPVKVLDGEKKIVVEEEGGDDVPEPVVFPVKDAEEVVLDDTSAPEVPEPDVVPVEEESSVIDEPEPEVDDNLPIVETAEGNADKKDVESLVEDEPAPSKEPVVEEPVIEDLEEAKKVEEHAAEIEVAPVVAGSRVEEEHTEDLAVDVAEVPPVSEEDTLPLAVDGHGHSDEESAGKKGLDVDVAEEPTSIVTEEPDLGDAEPEVEEPVATQCEPEGVVPSVYDDDVLAEVEDVPSAAEVDLVEQVDVFEPEPVEEVEVTEPENPEETLPVEEPLPVEETLTVEETLPVDETPLVEETLPVEETIPSESIVEVPVDAEPVIARPLPIFAVSELAVDHPVVEAQVVDSVDEAAPLPDEVEGPVPVVAASVEEPDSPSEVIEQEVLAASELAVEPLAEEAATDAPESDFPAEPTQEEVPPVESEAVLASQKTEAVGLPVPSEELAVDEVEPDDVSPAFSEPAEAEEEVPTPDVSQEETKSLERPWTPSYSVSSLGGGLDKVAPADEEVSEPTIVPEPPLEEPAPPAPEIITSTEEPVVAEPELTADDVQESSTWTPSYSTTVQGSSPRFESQATLESNSEPIPVAPEDVPTLTPEAEPVLAADGLAVEDPTQELTTVEPGDTPGGASETISWTPSYSTTVQGSGPHFESEAPSEDNSELLSSGLLPCDDVHGTTHDAQAIAETEATVEISEPTVTEGETSTTDVPAVDAPSEELSHSADPTSGQVHLAQPEEAAERPKSPWTPSYSVTTLPGSGSTPHVDSNLDETPAVEAEAEVLPVNTFEGTETPKIITPEDEEGERPLDPAAIAESLSWAQSYSVTSQPGSPRISPKAELDEFEPEPQHLESAQEPEPPLAVPIVELADVPETV
ncbi:hypothetical protein BJ322DRAFT_421677 [Thelephora terrestris]|uniref:Uncharacterized protein n=1 Tax=Thelephora terrestris TaxID=56493 RepID=A0A9P6HN32_9AGAM|nr:hypothetical protein BJ322DRAFT_421677 [Thelephora terrestris]